MIWRGLSGTAKFYMVFFLVCGGYASYSLVRVVAGLGKLREKAALRRGERRVANVRQIILLLLLLFGMVAANDAFVWVRGIRFWSLLQYCVGLMPFGPSGALTFAVFGALVFLHLLQWIASVWMPRRGPDLSG